MFERFAIPTPFQVGPVNAYVAGRTVVDPGPDSGDARTALAEGLAACDLAIGDVEQVLVTHAHPDHFGLANHLQSEGADVLASAPAAGIMAEFAARLEHEQTYFSALFEAHGMSPETVQTVTQLPEAFVEFAPSVAVDGKLADGDAVQIDGADLGVRSLDGHSEGELAFEWDAGEEESSGASPAFSAIVGDHVLPDTTPNPFLQPPPRDADEAIGVPDHDDLAALDDLRSRRLLAFNASLRELRDVGHDRMLPGHGDPIDAPANRIDAILDAHEERSAEVLALLDGPTTAVDVMHGLFPDLAVIDYFPGMCEALGHLDVLVDRGDVVREARDGELVYLRD